MNLHLIPLFFNLGTGEIIIIVFVLLLLFGGKKIPELMRGIGKGVRSFKEGVNDITDELNKPADADAAKADKTAEADKKTD